MCADSSTGGLPGRRPRAAQRTSAEPGAAAGTLVAVAKRALLLAAALSAALATGTAPGATAPPTLRLVGLSPITISGTNFRPLAAVHVTAHTARAMTVATRASRAGRFRIAFRGLPISGCGDPARVLARGAHGETATLLLPRPACMAH
jgi:hypothetical protein